jgi:pantothenate kinase type III
LHFLIDAGNTRIKVAALRPDGSLGEVSATPVAEAGTEDDLRLADFLDSLLCEAPATTRPRLVVSDPAGRVRTAMHTLRRRRSCSVEYMTAAALPGRVRTRNPERLGTDRLAAALGAYRRFGSQAVVVDMGTALCVDLVTADGAYAGGIVYPGVDLSYRALRDRTGLPLPAFSVPGGGRPTGMPDTTEEALRRGGRVVVPSVVGGLISHVREFAGADLPAVLTGGGCVPFLDLFPEGLPYDPHLNLRGIAEYVRLTTGVCA